MTTKVIVFIPGIGGSNLRSQQIPNTKTFLTFRFMTGLNEPRLNDEIKDINSKFNRDLIKDSDIRVLSFNLAPGYNKLSRFFFIKGWSIRNPDNNWQGKPNDSKEHVFYEFPYDWRRGIREHARDLNIFIESTVKSEFGNSDIYLISHSTGGIISRAYLSDLYKDSLPAHPKIKKQILIAAPNHGAPKAYRVLKTGRGFADNKFPGQYLPPNVKELSPEWPLVYELMADTQYEKYFPLYGPICKVGLKDLHVRETYIAKEHTTIPDEEIAKRYSLDEKNVHHVERALELHSDNELGRNTFLPLGDTYAIYCDTKETVTGVKWDAEGKDPKPMFKDIGDGTVPAKSVYDLNGLSDDGGKNEQPHDVDEGNFDPDKDHLIKLKNVGHSDLPTHLDVLGIVSSIVELT